MCRSEPPAQVTYCKFCKNLLKRIIHRTSLGHGFSKFTCKLFSLEDFTFLKNAYITVTIEQQQVRQMPYLNYQIYTEKDKNMNMTLGIAIGGSLFFLMLAIVIGVVAYLKKNQRKVSFLLFNVSLFFI